jgi:hypothetical protein
MSRRPKTLQTLPADQATDMLSRLDKGESLSNKDFANMGQSFEMFLRYGQMGDAAVSKFHSALRPHLERQAAA